MRMRKKPKEIICSFKQTRSVKITAELLGINKTTVYRWIRHSRSGWSNHLRENIYRKSTKPKNIHYKYFYYINFVFDYLFYF